MKYLATRGNALLTVNVEEHDGQTQVEINGESMWIDIVPIDAAATYSLLIDGRSYTATLLDTSDVCRVMINGRTYEFDIEAEELVRLRTEVKRKIHSGAEQIKAPMPGRVIAVEVAVGDPVEPDQGVVIMEAMKMENELRAHMTGKVKEVRVKAGDAVNKGDVLIVVEG